MECHSNHITILDSRPQTSYSQQHHRSSLQLFFYTSSAPQLWNQPNEILFGHFMTTLNHMHGCFSFSLGICRCSNFLINRTLILLEDKLLPVLKHGFFWSEENVILNIIPTLDGVWVLVCPVIFFGHIINLVVLYGRC